jgi:hypothetical protein
MDPIILHFILLKKRNLDNSQDVEIPKQEEMESYISSKSLSPSFLSKQKLYLEREKFEGSQEINQTILQLFDYEIDDDFAFKVTQHVIRNKMTSEEIHSLLSSYLESEVERRKEMIDRYHRFLSLVSKAPLTDRTYYFFSDGSFFRGDISTIKKKELIEVKHVVPLEVKPETYWKTEFIFRIRVPKKTRLLPLSEFVYLPPSRFIVDRISTLRMTDKNIVDSIAIFDLIFVGYY